MNGFLFSGQDGIINQGEVFAHFTFEEKRKHKSGSFSCNSGYEFYLYIFFMSFYDKTFASQKFRDSVFL